MSVIHCWHRIDQGAESYGSEPKAAVLLTEHLLDPHLRPTFAPLLHLSSTCSCFLPFHSFDFLVKVFIWFDDVPLKV